MLLASATKNKSPDISSSNAFLVQRLRASSTALVRLTFGQCRLPENVIEQVEIQVKYQGYIDRQNEEIDSRRDIETLKLPDDIDYSKVKGLSAEVQQKLNQHKPETVGQASRISGVTPAAVALLMVHLKRGFKDAK
ncbi:hypothetical protein QP713_03470 [Neisseria mucosa]|uniref:tRNA uridine 5-carboxymethylaminomethyl modification enzyme C-terminal subdomain domain-containing protein n=1 Tax=Neisseria mucosa TaxID=488 RepID=A0AAW6ZFM6_NEIMU|nr:hypothetical protein [Neisseria mucosa]MDK6725812.1 hypothetical protein [Neisseria mucosa]MDK6870221.1 hypothetical protein [Neisseria mucosa]MDK8109867.1 hypothetical protein [Neisseria mucosa]MDK8361173.1 hypothetical protein [Neisseria mucosa]